jgi:N-glycosidase YbiA
MEQVLFYRPQNHYGAFANFSKHPVEYKGLKGKTSEHVFQAMKFYPNHPDLVQMILDKDTPKEAAIAGRDKSLPLRKDWDLIVPSYMDATPIRRTKDLIMYEIVKDKFTRYHGLTELLCSTRGKVIVEDSPVDYYWGWGADHTGINMLGMILMFIRDVDLDGKV